MATQKSENSVFTGARYVNACLFEKFLNFFSKLNTQKYSIKFPYFPKNTVKTFGFERSIFSFHILITKKELCLILFLGAVVIPAKRVLFYFALNVKNFPTSKSGLILLKTGPPQCVKY